MEAEFSAEMLAGAPPWDVWHPHHQPSAPYQLCAHGKGPSHLRISSSAKQIEWRPEDLSRSSFQPVIVTQATPADTSAAHFEAGTWRMATSLSTLRLVQHLRVCPCHPTPCACFISLNPVQAPSLCSAQAISDHVIVLWGKESLPLRVSVCSYARRNSVYNILLYPLSHVVTHRLIQVANCFHFGGPTMGQSPGYSSLIPQWHAHARK